MTVTVGIGALQVLCQKGLMQERLGGLRYSIPPLLREAARSMQVCCVILTLYQSRLCLLQRSQPGSIYGACPSPNRSMTSIYCFFAKLGHLVKETCAGKFMICQQVRC